MKPTAAQITAFLKNPDPQVRVVLLYGPDRGLVSERADNLARKTAPDLNDPFSVSRIPASILSSDPARLYDEAATPALGGGKRLVLIQQASDSAASAIELLLEDFPNTDCAVILEAGDLDKRSKLRALCENEKSLAIAIPCYVEDADQRMRTIASSLENEGLKAEKEAIELLSAMLPPDRLALRADLEKLALFVMETKTVTANDVRLTLGDAGAAETESLVSTVADGDARRAGELLDRLAAEQVSPVALLRAAQRYFLRLHLARKHIDSGLGATEAVSRLQPKVFWKHEKTMARQALFWSAESIEKLLTALAGAEASIKKTGAPDIALCAQLFITAASEVRKNYESRAGST